MAEQYGVGVGTVSRVIDSVTRSIHLAFGGTVKMLSSREECHSISSDFHSVTAIPNVVRCVDGSLIPIQRPTVNEHVFVSRKGFHAINAMFVCKRDLRFTGVDASFPGASQDAAVYRESKVRQSFSDGNIPQGHLLGDSGYGLSSVLLTPVPHPRSNAEVNYNKAHRRTRNIIERALGVLKSRFRCIDKSGGHLRFSDSKCARVISAASILHNLAIEMGLPSPDWSDDNEFSEDISEETVENPHASITCHPGVR